MEKLEKSQAAYGEFPVESESEGGCGKRVENQGMILFFGIIFVFFRGFPHFAYECFFPHCRVIFWTQRMLFFLENICERSKGFPHFLGSFPLRHFSKIFLKSACRMTISGFPQFPPPLLLLLRSSYSIYLFFSFFLKERVK